ncbi:MAG: transporter substrate-binding domain-containing protein, partial [Oscillospiraceae bacterium]
MNKVKRICLIALSLLLLISAVPSACFAAESNDGHRTVRIGFPLIDGFSELDENGNPSGYTYEYLMRISQRGGWKPEFVICQGEENESILESIELLKSGKVDILGSMVYSEAQAEEYDFCPVPYGETGYTLVAKAENPDISTRTYLGARTLRVALSEKAKIQNALFENFCKTSRISVERIYARTSEECDALLASGKADVQISKDVSDNTGYKTIVKFASQPFYFAVQKGNKGLSEELGRLVTELENTDPTFRSKIFAKNFSASADREIFWTREERDYLDNAKPLKMALFTDKAPVQSMGDQSGFFQGIVPDVLASLSAQCSLQFVYVPVKNIAEAKALLKSGEVDLVAAIPYNYGTGDRMGVWLTSPILSQPIVRVENKNGDGAQEQFLISNSVTVFREDKNAIAVENIGDIFSQIDSGAYQTAYVSEYLSDEYLRHKRFSNVRVSPIAFTNCELCIGVRDGADMRIMSILEQGISRLTPEMLRDIVYQNTTDSGFLTVKEMVERNPFVFIFVIVLLLTLVIGFLFILFVRSKKMNRLITDEKQRFASMAKLDRMTGTYNNESFKILVRDYLSQTEPPPRGAFLMCDIDNFKDINDRFGHLVGDEVIAGLGRILTGMF